MRVSIRMEKKMYFGIDFRFEKRYLDHKHTSAGTAQTDMANEARPPLSDFEKNLEGRKHLMLKEIQYDVKKLEEAETRLRAVTDIMNVFS